MPGMYKYSMEIESNVKKLLLDTKELQDRMDTLEGKEYKINLNIDEKKLGNVISNLEKMLDSLGKGTGDFKQFENLSKELSSIVSEVQSLSKSFGKVDDSGTKTLLSSIQNIDKSLSELSQNILNVNKNMSNMDGNTSGAVKQVENISNAYQDATKEAEKLADAQSKIGQKTNISLVSNSTVEQQIKSESELNAEIEKRENIIRELQQLQEKLTVHEDFHGNDRYFADQLPTEEEIREADKRIKQLTGTNNIFDVNKLIQDRNKWLSEVKYSLEEYDDLIKANDQKALDEYTTRGLSRISGAESFFGYEDNNFSIASKFVEEKEKIKNEINDLYTDLDKLGEKMNLDSNNSSVDNTVQSQEKLQSELKETQKQAEKTAQAVKESTTTASTEQTKDAFPDASTNTKTETECMEQVEKATEEAVQAKKDFATANEGVQSSIDESENPLKLEAELMEQIAKSAREAADAKKEFVEANKQVKESADESNSDLKAKPKKDKYAKRRKISEEDFLNYSPNKVNEKLSNSGYTILGETVNTELVDGLVKVSAKIKDVDGVWKSFSAKVDADGNIFEQRFKTITNGVDKLETALQNFGYETAPALTYQETLDKAQKIKNNLNLGDEYSIKVDSSEFVTITKKLTDVENAGSSVTQTFKSAQDAIDNFGKATSNSAEKTSVALKSVKSNVKEVVDETEKLANAQKEQNANVNFNKYDKRLDSYNGKIDKYKTTIDRFNDGGWTSSAYLDNVQAVKNAVKEYETLLNELKGKDASLVTSDNINKLDKYEKKIKDTIATVTNMSASEKGYNFVSSQKELDKIHKLLAENSKMSSEAKNKIKAYYAEIESGNPSMSLDKIHAEIMKIYNAEVEAGRAGKSVWDTFKSSGFHQIIAQAAGIFSLYDVINVGKQFASTVIDINTQITELAKVSEQSSKQIYSDFDSYADIAEDVRGTISDTISATADWSKNGYSIPDAKQLAEISQLYKNVGDGIDIDEANESLISTLKGFQLEADQAEHIVDVFNEVSNNEAISSAGIGEALQRSAASFNAASTDLEKSVALVSATNSVLQDPEKVGKQILAYLYSNVMKIKVAISVKPLRRARPRKDYNVCFNY
jgi:DNA repair exonuclease SbcCD ATPase subunit